MKYCTTVIVQKSERGLHKTVREQQPGLAGVLPDYPKGRIGILKTPYLDFRSNNTEESHTTRGGGATRPPLHLRAPKKDEHITVETPSRKYHGASRRFPGTKLRPKREPYYVGWWLMAPTCMRG